MRLRARGCGTVHRRESDEPLRQVHHGTSVAFSEARRFSMLMFKRSQVYIALALAGLAEFIVRAVAR